MGGQKWTDLVAERADTLPRTVAQWPEEAWVAYQERLAMMLTDPWADEGEAARDAEQEVRVMVRAGRLRVWEVGQ